MLGSTSNPWWSCCCPRSVAMLQGKLHIFGRGTLFGRPLKAELPSFASMSFYSSVGSSVVDTYTKAVVGRAMYPPPHPDEPRCAVVVGAFVHFAGFISGVLAFGSKPNPVGSDEI
ncbi:hypothetical protein BHE74_00005800 [Ensete ventricosum]|nr:hypothetical protein BHE74_00005800 [Ensete ventricosum]